MPPQVSYMVLVKLIAKSVGGDRMHGALSHARADGRNLGTIQLTNDSSKKSPRLRYHVVNKST